MPIGERIKKARKERHLSQSALAKMAGISQSGLCSIENGNSSPKECTIIALADALGISVNEIMGAYSENNDMDDEILSIREEIRRNPELRMLFSTAKGVNKEDLQAAIRILQGFKNSSKE